VVLVARLCGPLYKPEDAPRGADVMPLAAHCLGLHG